MKNVVFLLVVLKTASGFLKSDSYKINETLKESFSIPNRRIYGGIPATENQFPFMVILIHFNFDRTFGKCSGSLLKTDMVLTAAHCTKNLYPKNSIVVGGQVDYSSYFAIRLLYPARAKFNSAIYNAQERWPSQFITHSGYKDGKLFHDIALIRLREPFTLPNITTVSLSKRKMVRPTVCTILGWGLTETKGDTFILHYGITIAKPSDWGCDYVDDGPVLCLEIGNPATCHGDSGSPLICADKVWGVAAFIRYIGRKTCENAEDFYTEIYSELDWLNNPTTGGSSVAATSKNNDFFTYFCLLFLFEKFSVYL